MPSGTGVQPSGGAQMQSGQETTAGAQSMTNLVRQQDGAQNTADASAQNGGTDGAQQQGQQPTGPRGLFSQAPDPGHTSEEK